MYISGLCLDLDPDVVAALDEDFDFEDPDNQLEDNFIDLAMAESMFVLHNIYFIYFYILSSDCKQTDDRRGPVRKDNCDV